MNLLVQPLRTKSFRLTFYHVTSIEKHRNSNIDRIAKPSLPSHLANLTLLTQPPPPFSDQGTRSRFPKSKLSLNPSTRSCLGFFLSNARSSQASRGSKRGVAVPKGGKIGCYPTRICHGNSSFGGRNSLVYPRFAVQLAVGRGNVLNSP